MWVCTHVSARAQHPEVDVGFAGAGVIGGCELKNFGPKNQTWVSCKSSLFFNPRATSLALDYLVFMNLPDYFIDQIHQCCTLINKSLKAQFEMSTLGF